jgi:hypothetical protein
VVDKEVAMELEMEQADLYLEYMLQDKEETVA